MKTVFAICLSLLLLAPISEARKKKPPAPPPTYDLVGVLSHEAPEHDYESHHNASNGDSYDAYCDTSGNSVTCTEGIDVRYYITVQGTAKRYLVRPEAVFP